MFGAQYKDVPASFDAPSLCGFASSLVHDMLEAGLPHGLPSRAICRYDHDHVQPRAKFDGYKDDVAAVFEGGPVTTLLAAMHHVSNLQLLFADLNRKIKKDKFPAAALLELYEYRLIFFEDDPALRSPLINVAAFTLRQVDDIFAALRARAAKPGAWFLGCGSRPTAAAIKKLIKKHQR